MGFVFLRGYRGAMLVEEVGIGKPLLKMSEKEMGLKVYIGVATSRDLCLKQGMLN